MNTHESHRPVVLIVLDGWGVDIASQSNAITRAKTPFFDSLVAQYPTRTLQASGEATGLPWGEVGNSEVGHMSIGAGRIVFQELSRVNAMIKNGTIGDRPAIADAFAHVKERNSALHIIGLASTGGVHSHIDHLYALLELAKGSQIPRVYLHVILDGRDTPYASGLGTVQGLKNYCANTAIRIATISGRFHAMDRDSHWDRIEMAYNAMAKGASEFVYADPEAAVHASYENHIYDEEFVPTVITDESGTAHPIEDGDAVIFFNIRADRARQLTRAFTDPDFDKFAQKKYSDLSFTTFTQYDPSLPVRVAFEPQTIRNSLAQVISESGKKQLHVAETEKYAHITYFLNDGREDPFPGENRVMIPSPSVESYDKKPEMSAREITSAATEAIKSGEYDFIAINFANADMVGHTGNIKAAIKAVETIDGCLKRIITDTLGVGGAAIITADHGNAENMIDLKTGIIDKEHSNNPVPCIIVSRQLEGALLDEVDVSSKDLSILETSGILSDVAPTVLELMGIPKPLEMTGNSLLAS